MLFIKDTLVIYQGAKVKINMQKDTLQSQENVLMHQILGKISLIYLHQVSILKKKVN